VSVYDLDQRARDLLAELVESNGTSQQIGLIEGRPVLLAWRGSALLRMALEHRIARLWDQELARSKAREGGAK
jgi:hypothetical protein